MSLAGRKDDNGKLRWDLVPWEELEVIVQVLTVGANKYGAENWKFVEEGKARYFAAALRHITAWRKGSLNDEEDQLPHLAHAVCCLLFIMYKDGQMNETTIRDLLTKHKSSSIEKRAIEIAKTTEDLAAQAIIYELIDERMNRERAYQNLELKLEGEQK